MLARLADCCEIIFTTLSGIIGANIRARSKDESALLFGDDMWLPIFFVLVFSKAFLD